MKAEKLENANERGGKEATFPAQALSCSGSTGIISALYSPFSRRIQHPGNFIEPVFRRQHKYKEPAHF